MQVNRYLSDKAMDRIDHALGRPVNPMKESYRNHYAVGAGSPLIGEMLSSGHWIASGRIGSDMVFMFVTDAGRRALRDHLRKIGDRNRIWRILWNGHESTEVAETRGKAMYSKWLHVSDAYDISFRDFLRSARISAT